MSRTRFLFAFAGFTVLMLFLGACGAPLAAPAISPAVISTPLPPTATATATNTAVPPTQTPLPTATATATSTATSTPAPTGTPIPAPSETPPPTNTPHPSNTPVPPTATAEPATIDPYALPNGKGGLLARNYIGKEVSFTIADKEYKIAASVGAGVPGELFIVLPPGRYTYSVSVPGGSANGEIVVEVGMIWVLPLRM